MIYSDTALLCHTELDGANPKLMNEYRTLHTARGSDRSVRDVTEMLEEHERFANMFSEMKG